MSLTPIRCPAKNWRSKGAFSVNPAIEGALTWSADGMALTFTPDAPFARATEYTFTIDTGATSAEGVPLEEPFTLTLRTVGYLGSAAG